VQHHIQIAGRTVALARLALAAQPDLRAVIHAGRDRHGQLARPLHDAGPGALLARRVDDFAAPVAARALGHVHHAAQERLPDLAHLAGAVTVGAGARAGAHFGAAAVAHVTRVAALDLDINVGPKDRLFELDREIVAQIAPLHRPGPAAAGAHAEPAEELLENLVEARESPAEPPEAARHPAVHTGMAEAVVGRALVVVGEHAVRLVDLLEAFFGVRCIAHVGVILARQAAKRAFDVVF